MKTQTDQKPRLFVLVFIMAACFAVSNAKAEPLATWVGGSNQADQVGVYGTKGVPDPANFPGARNESISWIDSNGNLWLFGGWGAAWGAASELNDLWKYDGTNWTWVSGSDEINYTGGVYGTKGDPDPANFPGGRAQSVSWIDSSDNLWLFGGFGIDSGHAWDALNDLWKYDGTNWTWVSGSNIGAQPGVYGTKGDADAANIPGARGASSSWIDSSDNLWLFGGGINDLWKFDGTDWTWVSGSKIFSQPGVYGAKGVPDPNNVPGARDTSITWIDSSDNLWLFGGWGYDSNGSGGLLNDLWKFDGTDWTWVSGSNIADQIGVYGTKGVANAANVPGARTGSISWTDSNANLWLLGGMVIDSSGAWNRLNDLWKFDGSDWTWIGGSDSVGQLGVYGTKGVADAANFPGARDLSISWIDSSDNLWLFGGIGIDSTSVSSNLNDFWKIQMNQDASLVVTSPISNELWARGGTYKIRWAPTNPSVNVKILLFKGGSKVSTLKSSTANDGVWKWTVPNTLALGDDYKIKVVKLDDKTVVFSDLFEIARPGDLYTPIEVSVPNSSSVWYMGSKVPINWTGAEQDAEVKIKLYKGKKIVKTIKAATKNDGTALWTVPYSLAPGTNYRVKIFSTDYSYVKDASAKFEIRIPPIEVTAPPAAKEWKRGYTYPIKWTGGKPSANVKIQLLRNKPDGTVVFKTLTIATPNDGVFKWKVPSKQALDDDYRVRVIYLPDTTIRDVSETFKIVTGPVVYEVWGGSTDYFSEPQWWEYYENIDQQDYVKLGESYGESATFHGNYKYYVIAARRAFLLDCVQGSNDQYPNDFYLGGNLENEENIRHAPDGQYATIGAFDGGGTFRGFIVFQNYNRNWTSIKVYTDR